ncbi:MAG: hypothetical protein JSS49_26585 [Planctomycetes bacterium]|nr:hypothetical protein [Planctomycetota bacterium]
MDSYVLAQQMPQELSFGGWRIMALTNLTGIAALASAVLVFAGAVKLVRSQQRPAALAAYLVLLPLPTLIALVGVLQGMSDSFIVIASLSEQTPSQQDYAGGFASALVMLVASLIATAPTYALLAFALISRTMNPQPSRNIETVVPARNTPVTVGPLPATP